MKISISLSLSLHLLLSLPLPHTSHLILDNIYKDRKGDLHLFKKTHSFWRRGYLLFVFYRVQQCDRIKLIVGFSL